MKRIISLDQAVFLLAIGMPANLMAWIFPSVLMWFVSWAYFAFAVKAWCDPKQWDNVLDAISEWQ